MKEMIIVAGKSKSDLCWLRRCLREKGYNSIPCKTAKQVAEELEILPTCDVSVILVVIEPEILEDISDDLLGQLSDCAVEIPFLLFNEINTEPDLAETFDRICEYRTQFRPEQNPELDDVLKENGVETIYS